MKKVLKYAVFLLTMAITVAGCSAEIDNEDEESQAKYYYVVGYDGSTQVILQNGTARSETFLFISENLKDSLQAYNWNPVDDRYFDLTESLFDIVPEMWSGSCGLAMFSEEYRFKVQMTCRPITKGEGRDLLWFRPNNCAGPLSTLGQKFKPVIITSISKIQ